MFSKGAKIMKRATKRKIKRLYNKNSFLFLGILVFAIVTMMSTGYALLNEKLTLNGKSTIKNENEGKDPEDLGEVCTTGISFSLRSSWGGNRYQYDMVMTNNSDEAYYSWQIKIPSDSINIVSGSANIQQKNGATYISNLSHQAELDSGESTEAIFLDITYDGDIEALFSKAIITACGRASGEKKVITDGPISITLEQLEVPLEAKVTLQSDWGSEKLYTIVLYNNNDVDVTGFRVLLYYGMDNTVSNTYSWNKDLTTYADEHIMAANNGWAQQGEISAGGHSETFYLQIKCSDSSFLPNIVAAGVSKIS